MEKEELIEAFIISIKEKPETWDLRNLDHKNHVVVNQKFQEILSFLRQSFPNNLLVKHKYDSVKELKQRLRNFRSAMGKEKKKVKGK